MLTAIDLFSGCGGFSLGASLAGFKIMAAIERDRHACATYKRNLISTDIAADSLIQDDILAVSPKQLLNPRDLALEMWIS